MSFTADHIRPTTDRVKESIFNKLQGAVEGARVLDLFSGTGNLSIESLSRGAKSVVAVEDSRKSLQIMKKNRELLGIGIEWTVIEMDALKYLQRYQGEPFDLVFADPPFTKKLADSVLKAAAESACIGRDTWMIIESAQDERADDHYGRDLVRFDSRDFGDKLVSYFSRKEDHDSSSISG